MRASAVTPDDPVSSIKGVGEHIARKFEILGVKTISDLIHYYPRRYDDYSTIVPIRSISPNSSITVEAKITNIAGRYVRRGLHITEALATDKTGTIKIVWFNQPYRASGTKLGQTYYISGSFELTCGRLAMMNPSTELVSEFPLNSARIVPIYRETKGLKSASIRKALAQILPQIREIKESFPRDVIEKYRLVNLSGALESIHFPQSLNDIELAKERLGFEELFCLILASLLNKEQFKSDSGVTITFNESLAKAFVGSLPFPLTNAQRKVAWQIFKDMQDTTPMNRLVEGDVGSGKTVVAALAAVMVMDAGYQVMLMAPTEILAMQHLENIKKLFKHIGLEEKVGFLSGSLTAGQKKQVKSDIAKGSVGFVVGTHALLTDDVGLQKLGLVIVDEQHRFGVKQRKKLQEKAHSMPHVLNMTATPIPRSLALTIYGDLDISVIDEMPPGRQEIVTELVSPNSRTKMYAVMKEQIEAGRQIFVVCPLIEESENIPVYSAEKVYDQLSKSVFKHSRVALLHGKMKQAEKDAIMTQFVNLEYDILVSTTVIEVGVDVPNATVMVIEAAERFGLAQLHQLRGRVGRGSHASFCFLVMSDSKEPPRRLRSIVDISDGFKLAEIDLELRGPGAIYGVIQSGQLDLKMANITDVRLIAKAREAAQQFIGNKYRLTECPELSAKVDKNRKITNLN